MENVGISADGSVVWPWKPGLVVIREESEITDQRHSIQRPREDPERLRSAPKPLCGGAQASVNMT